MVVPDVSYAKPGGGHGGSRGGGSHGGGHSFSRGGGGHSSAGRSFSRGGGGHSSAGRSSHSGGRSSSSYRAHSSSRASSGHPSYRGGHQEYSGGKSARSYTLSSGNYVTRSKGSSGSHNRSYTYDGGGHKSHQGGHYKKYVYSGGHHDGHYNTYSYRGGHHGGHYGDHHYLSFSPYGFGYGYHSGHFSLFIGPYGWGYPSYGYYGSPYYYGSYDGYYDDSYYASDDYDDYDSAVAVVPTNEQAVPFQARAEQAFRAAQYGEAVRQSNHAVVEDGQNGLVHLFAAQALFAVNDYDAAAAAIHRGLTLAERKDWGFVVNNYKRFYRNDDYVAQMNQLIEAIEKYPEVPSLRFVRGYHYVFLDHKKAALKELTKAVALDNRNPMANELLAMVGGPPVADTTESATSPAPALPGAVVPASGISEDLKAEKNPQP